MKIRTLFYRKWKQGVKGETYKKIVDRKEAIQYVMNEAKAGDVILIAGKGHETYQQIGQKY